jgi:hypothetical protein
LRAYRGAAMMGPIDFERINAAALSHGALFRPPLRR